VSSLDGRSRGASYEGRTTVNGERRDAEVWAARASCDATRPPSSFPARRTPASRASAARARCSSTATSCARASFSLRRPTGTTSSPSRGSEGRRSIPCRRHSPDAGAVQCGLHARFRRRGSRLLRRIPRSVGRRFARRSATSAAVPIPEDPRRGAGAAGR
jgi:hypothetical protein